MSNRYKNAFYTPTAPNTADTDYTCPNETPTIFQTLQHTNITRSKNVTVSITDTSASATFVIAYVEMTGPLIINVLKGSIVLEAEDILKIETTATSGISGTAALLETTRVYIADTGAS